MAKPLAQEVETSIAELNGASGSRSPYPLLLLGLGLLAAALLLRRRARPVPGERTFLLGEAAAAHPVAVFPTQPPADPVESVQLLEGAEAEQARAHAHPPLHAPEAERGALPTPEALEAARSRGEPLSGPVEQALEAAEDELKGHPDRRRM
ncbi:hypothetical protein HNR42_003515 [Deinobacterium chartae]|uniref:Uncharacterized protein n=1 Tax=Deinobacterium chartae TaxID=521158 RepID=A0A841I6L3_9DEIO|nr:hypothetical protein [Deinobacterium chartae]MBB6100050.1 hypothetical protein [Deinobacterium chartae]